MRFFFGESRKVGYLWKGVGGGQVWFWRGGGLDIERRKTGRELGGKLGGDDFGKRLESGQGRRSGSRCRPLGWLWWPRGQRRKFFLLLGATVAILVLAASEMEAMEKGLHNGRQLGRDVGE